jgi:hypothetical protein
MITNQTESPQQTQLLQRSYSIIQADLLGDLAVLDAKHGRAGESHLPTGCRRKRADEEVTEGRAGVGAAAFPATDHVVALGNQIRRTPELEIRKRLAESGHELLHVLTAATRCVQRVLQEDVGGGELVDDPGVPGIAPELREPSAHDGLVVLFFRHDQLLRLPRCRSMACGAAHPLDLQRDVGFEAVGETPFIASKLEMSMCGKAARRFYGPRARRRRT